MGASFTLKAPAKINWSLYVLDRRADGYHNILSLMQCIGLYDTLTFEDADLLQVDTSGMDIPVDVESGKGTIDILAMIQQKPFVFAPPGGSTSEIWSKKLIKINSNICLQF